MLAVSWYLKITVADSRCWLLTEKLNLPLCIVLVEFDSSVVHL